MSCSKKTVVTQDFAVPHTWILTPMARRSRSRQVAVQMLYQVDLNPDMETGTIREMIADRISDAQLIEFAWQLFAGVMEHRAQIDEQLQHVARNWRLSRMAATDRAVLRLGAYELLQTSTPPSVVIDEAIEVAKKFGNAQSPVFVNGVLDQLIPGNRKTPDNDPPVEP